MASRRILSNSNLAPIQELAVNPYNSFNSDSINKLTRIVSGGKDKDVVVNGLDVNSQTDKKWYASSELLPKLNDSDKWSGENYYILSQNKSQTEDIVPVVHFELPHQNSYGFSYIKCDIDDSCVKHLYKSSYFKIYEVSFKLDMGTPKTIVAKLNDCEATIDHPQQGKTYTIPLTKVFKNDKDSKGLVFTFGAVLDAADPECSFETKSNKTYIVVSNISFKMKGYEFPEFERSIGPVHHKYDIGGIHPTHNLEITPGIAIKDDVMLEELAPSIDKYKRIKLDLTSAKSWIKNNPFTIGDFDKEGKRQLAYQCNDKSVVYQPRLCKYVDNELRVCIKDHDNLDKWIRPVDDIRLTYDVDGNLLDREFTFDRYTDDDEYHNFTLYSEGNVFDNITSYNNTIIVCFVDDDGKYRIIGYKINVINNKNVIVAPNIDPNTPDVTELSVDDQATNIPFDNGKSFTVPILSCTLPKKISDYGSDWKKRIRGFVSIGPTKVCGDPELYNEDMTQWGYVVLYYAYFKNPKPNTSYIGLIRESDLESNRDDYLVLAKVRFIDPTTVDIISYENRQSKQLPNSDYVEYFSTCDYPEIWDGNVPTSVTDAINKLALFDHNFARLIRFKHDFNAPINTAFSLADPHGREMERTPFVHINADGHLERKIRVDKSKLIISNISDDFERIMPEDGSVFTSSDDTTFSYKNSMGDEWRIKFNPVLSDFPSITEFGLRITAALGKYDVSSDKIVFHALCFNNIGPFKFVDFNSGDSVCELDWKYFDDILVYPTSPSVSLDSQSLLYPTAPYSTTDDKGVYVDTDKGSLNGAKYLDDNDGLKGGRFLLSYDDPVPQNSSILNSRENHFNYLVFRNRLMVSSYFLKMLDILPKKSYGKNSDGEYVYEGLINKRILVGSDAGDGGNVHIESSATSISDTFINGNLLNSMTVDGAANIQSTDYAIPNKKDETTGDYDYTSNAEEANYTLTDNAVLVSKKRNDDSIDIISSNYELTATGNNTLLNSVVNSGNGLIDIQNSKHSIDENLTNGNIIRAKVTEEGDTLESTKYAIPNKKTGDEPSTATYDFTTDSSDANYELKDEAILMAKKRNDDTIDIISSKFAINAGNKGQVLISNATTDGLTTIQSSKHYISDNLKNGNIIIAENPKSDDSNGDELKSSIYSIPDTKVGDFESPMDSSYAYTGTGTYQLKDGALLTAKKRDDNNVDIISSKYAITAAGDNKIIISDYEDADDKLNSLIDVKSSNYTVGDVIGQWYTPKVELRCDSWWNSSKPRIVVVIDDVHNFTIRVSEIVKSIHDQFDAKYSYGDGNVSFTENTFKSLFNSKIGTLDRRVCDITVVIDLTEGNSREIYNDEKDGYKALEALCRSKLVIVNDINTVNATNGSKFRPYVRMTFDYSDSIKSKDASIHYEGSEVVYGFDTNYEFTGTKRSAEHLHSEPLIYVNGRWILAEDYLEQESNIIWDDQYRGYNNTQTTEEDGTVNTSLVMYPVDKDDDLNNTSAMSYDASSTKYSSGYGYARGPLSYVYAGNKAEYTFNHVKTMFDPEGIVYPTDDDGNNLFTCSKCKDVIYAHSKYYITSNQF